MTAKSRQEVAELLSFKDVISAQNQIREIVERLIYMNKCLNFQERKRWFELVARSLIGEGINFEVIIKHDKGRFDLGDLQTFAHRISYIQTQQVTLTSGNNSKTFEIQELWQALLDVLLEAFGVAQLRSYSKSSEREKHGGDGALAFNPTAKRSGGMTRDRKGNYTY